MDNGTPVPDIAGSMARWLAGRGYTVFANTDFRVRGCWAMANNLLGFALENDRQHHQLMAVRSRRDIEQLPLGVSRYASERELLRCLSNVQLLLVILSREVAEITRQHADGHIKDRPGQI